MNSTFTWTSTADYSLRLVVSADTRCMSAPGSNLLTAKLYKVGLGGSPTTGDANATLTATVSKPSGSSAPGSFSFDNNASQLGDGNFTYRYPFDANGTYKFQVHAIDLNGATADQNAFVYVGDFNINISWVNNNMAYNAGDSASARVFATNDDRNEFSGLSGTVTIYYPSASVFAQDQSFTESGTTAGEYYYNFTAPSTSGTYSETAAFSCGVNTDSNSLGRFSVNAATTPSTAPPPSGGGGGGGGGGGLPPAPRLKARIVQTTANPIELGTPSMIRVEVQNLDITTQSFLVLVKITQGQNVEYIEQETVFALPPNQRHQQLFSQPWIPLYAGTHLLSVELYSLDKVSRFDSNIMRLDVNGSIRYDVIVHCPTRIVPAGELTDFSMQVYNAGDYFEDVELSWELRDTGDELLASGAVPIAVKPGETIYRPEKALIPESASPETHFIRAQAKFQEQVKEGQCSFSVESRYPYYDGLVSELEDLVNQVQRKIDERKSSGYEVVFPQQKLVQLNDRVKGYRNRLNQRDFEGFGEGITQTRASLIQLLDDLEQLSFGFALLQSPMVWLMLGIILLLLLLLLWRGDREERRKSALDELLGLDLDWPSADSGRSSES